MISVAKPAAYELLWKALRRRSMTSYCKNLATTCYKVFSYLVQ